ncbi:MAG: inositol-3-phosphate synthase [Paracoccaceae bacterium]
MLTTEKSSGRTLGIAVVGLGGGVATTMVAGLEMMRRGMTGTEGLPLAEIDIDRTGLSAYGDIVCAGWDVNPQDLASAVREHGVLSEPYLAPIEDRMSAIRPWKAGADRAFCANIEGSHVADGNSKRSLVEQFRADLRRFRVEKGLDDLVVINLASTEKVSDPLHPDFATPAAFSKAVDDNHDTVAPAMLYAYAAILEGVPFGNFTPSLASEMPALVALANERGVPLAGRDGKTGQTFMKTVLAPALRGRALHVDGWYSTNILGNRDGKALEDPASLGSKLHTKGGVLDQILGYPVENHLVQISYYKPRGDNKEAWDNIDVTGFLGERMQIKINFLCKDSILAAPRAIEIARCRDLAKRRGEAGPIEALSTFFKAPLTRGGEPEHAFGRQQAMLMDWLGAGTDPMTGTVRPAATAAE